MEWKIENLKPAAISWAITLVLLLVAAIYNYMTENSLGIEGIIFFAALAVYFTAYLSFRKK